MTSRLATKDCEAGSAVGGTRSDEVGKLASAMPVAEENATSWMSLGGPDRIVLLYATIAATWILLSDGAIGLIIDNPKQMAVFGALKGWVFVALTSAILYGLMTRMVRSMTAMHGKISQEQYAKLKAMQLLDVIAERSTDAIFVKDTSGRYLLFNREAGRFVGKDSASVIGLDDSAIFPLEEAEALMESDRRLMEQGETRTIEEVMTTPLGVRTFLATKGPFYDEHCRLMGLFGISRDITERKNTELALRQREELLKEVQTVANLGHYVYDRADDRWESSEVLDRLFGIGPDYPRDATHWLALVVPEMRPSMSDYLASIMERGDSFDHEYAIERADDGQRRWVAGLGRIDRDAAGRPIRMVGTIQDITERITAEQAVHEKNNQLIQSNADLEQFAYVAAHDLQTPLRNIVHYTQLLDRRFKGRLDADAEEFISYVVDSGRQMTRLLSDLLEYSHVSNRSHPLCPTSTREAVDRALRHLKRHVDEVEGEITVGGLPSVMGEPSQLVSLFQNLIGNALKYRAPDRKPRLSVTAERVSPDCWRFAVADNGIGIEPQYFEKIFEMFQRLDPAASTEGTGIGLTLCRRIVHRFGGTIWVESTPDAGATFFFTLPDGSAAT